MSMISKGDYIVYVDESGDHGLKNVDANYPIFVITLCCFKISEYIEKAVPELQKFKFKYFGHDQIVLHENDIRKNRAPFQFLRTDKELRLNFLNDLSKIIVDIPFRIIPILVDKNKLKLKYADSFNPYHLGLRFGLKQLSKMLLEDNQKGKEISLVFEKRGLNEDRDLELEFLRICSTKEMHGYKQMQYEKMAYRFFAC